MKLKIINYFLGIPVLIASNGINAESQPKFNIIPNGPTPTKMSAFIGQNLKIAYTVTNNTKLTRTLTIIPQSGVIQTTGAGNSCSTTGFTLAPYQQCILNLSITVPPKGVHGGPKVCKTTGSGNNQPDLFLCSQPTDKNNLAIDTKPFPELIRKVAVGSTGLPLVYTSTNGGASWSSPLQLPIPTNNTQGSLLSVACDTKGLLCAAVGIANIDNNFLTQIPIAYFSTNGGSSWTSSPTISLPAEATFSTMSGVACSANGTICVASGSQFNGFTTPLSYYSTNGGRSWTLSTTMPPPVTNRGNVRGIDCDNLGEHCIIVGFARTQAIAYFSNDHGQNWTTSTGFTVPPNGTSAALTTVACSDSGLHCIAGGKNITTSFPEASTPLTFVSTDRGQNWRPSVAQPAPNPNFVSAEILSINCSNDGLTCVAVGTSKDSSDNAYNISYQTTDGGDHWSSQQDLSGISTAASRLNAVQCDGAGILCTTVGSSSPATIYSYQSINSGGNWGSAVFPQLPAGTTNANLFGLSGNR